MPVAHAPKSLVIPVPNFAPVVRFKSRWLKENATVTQRCRPKLLCDKYRLKRHEWMRPLSDLGPVFGSQKNPIIFSQHSVSWWCQTWPTFLGIRIRFVTLIWDKLWLFNTLDILLMTPLLNDPPLLSNDVDPYWSPKFFEKFRQPRNVIIDEIWMISLIFLT